MLQRCIQLPLSLAQLTVKEAIAGQQLAACAQKGTTCFHRHQSSTPVDPPTSSTNNTIPDAIPASTSAAVNSLVRTMSKRKTRSGYTESTIQTQSQASEQPGVPLRVELRESDAEQEERMAQEDVDYYKLSRLLFTDEQLEKKGGVQLDDEAARILNKLVGCLTKEGKRGAANRILLDAMHIIRTSADKPVA